MNAFQLSEWLPSFLLPFFTLSYPTDAPVRPDSFHDSPYYNTGLLDGCIIVTCIAVMAVLRDISRIYIMEPFAKWKLTRDWKRSKTHLPNGTTNGAANGVTNGTANGNGHSVYTNGKDPHMPPKQARKIHRSVLRFAEQGWSAIYYTVQWSFGLYVHINLPTSALHPTELWLDYPHIPLPGPLKFYYLTQTAFYLHQVLILNAEARRKDHYQMMTHHVITIILMVASYFYNFTRVGCLIMVLMDWCDIFLPVAKMLRYIKLYTLCDAMFTWFLLSWFVTRHVFFIIVIKSAIMDAPRLIRVGWSPEFGAYYSEFTHFLFEMMLVALQIIQFIWFWMICRVAWRVVSGKGAADERSDDESDSNKKDE
ncbi:TLC domain-containing protein [Hygrophoropsis aurantiaca]|uniref:TLC domain-containing protein n=1 Tax=Hygrophoropsis aurantiaca TaxID=72124 RepID=A0ACB8A5Y6_9AGAM|nr:TLC domain-containing protein [Hygrophoropsis aurantiaca]